jgi:hypothetical protein
MIHSIENGSDAALLMLLKDAKVVSRIQHLTLLFEFEMLKEFSHFIGKR